MLRVYYILLPRLLCRNDLLLRKGHVLVYVLSIIIVYFHVLRPDSISLSNHFHFHLHSSKLTVSWELTTKVEWSCKSSFHQR